MSKQISAILKRKLDDISAYGAVDAETCRNALKEELQFYVLNFIYHHPKYNEWIMYGGSALRIIHGLDRMSVDLDFEVPHAVTEKFLEELKEEAQDHFTNTYGTNADFLTVKITNGRGLTLKFHIGEELSFGHPSRQVHVKIDLNHFVAPKTVIERRPINRDQLSFVIVTYNMSALMASKIAAIFQRGTRGVGKVRYEEKGRDIYDLLWYMNKKVVPDFDYLKAKDVEEAKDVRTLFDKLTLKMNTVSDENLKQDLAPLFVNRGFIENWLKNWRESYLGLLGNYKIHTVTELVAVGCEVDYDTDALLFTYVYATEDESKVDIKFILSNDWITSVKEDLKISIDNNFTRYMTAEMRVATGKKAIKQKQYAVLLYQKIEKYFKKTNRIVLGESITTKVICMTAKNLNQKEEVVLNKSALLSCELDDLLK
ncbi:MAG: nucleotidyl transferase AbiEii/AbiGii toxin family protein [Patescibacteria group bacterium]